MIRTYLMIFRCGYGMGIMVVMMLMQCGRLAVGTVWLKESGIIVDLMT
jgi:hypothetical protein